MLEIKNKKDCCGCGACVQKCPKKCITFKEDDEGFLYPHINKKECIDCGLCEKVCPIINPQKPRTPLYVEAAQNVNGEDRISSSSGGIFISLAKYIYSKNGFVVGTVFDENWETKQTLSHHLENIFKMRGSKYIQSRTENTFIETKTKLEEGMLVLYTGTPCQIAGLKNFLKKEYDNLITLDFICHGVPSPKIWRHYLKKVKKKTIISNIEFRNKTKRGWGKFSLVIHKEKGRHDDILLSEKHHNNLYMKAFLSNIILRPSCYVCPVKGLRSQSDLTIADFWNVEKILPDWNDDMGTSLILINTNKGKQIIENTSDELRLQHICYEQVKRYNSAIIESARYPAYRRYFFDEFKKGKPVNKLILKYCYNPKDRIKQIIKSFLQTYKIYND